MKFKKSLLGIMAASAALAIFSTTNSTSVQAATIQMPTQGTSYVRKGNTYKLHLKVAGKVTVNTKAKYTIVNTSDWKCIPYPGKDKNTKVFYLRAGNYKLTTKSAARVKTTYTKLSKLRKSFESFPNSHFLDDPIPIEMGKTYKGLTDMFHPEKFRNNHNYVITLDEPKKLTMTMSSMPVYALGKGDISSNTSVWIEAFSQYSYDIPEWRFKGQASNKQNTWYLDKGTYIIRVSGPRGRYSFKLDSEYTNLLPAQSKVEKVTPTEKGLQVDYTKADGATGYEIFSVDSNKKFDSEPKYYNQNSVNGISGWDNTNSDQLSQVIPENQLVNGKTYNITVRSLKKYDGAYIFGNESKPVTYTYYVPLKGEKTVPKAPVLKAKYYDDHGNDEPYIDMKWNVEPDADSYEIAYRVKGEKDWHQYFTKNKGWENISNSTDEKDPLYFVKGKTYEVKVRALHSNLVGSWSNTQTVTVTVTPAM